MTRLARSLARQEVDLGRTRALLEWLRRTSGVRHPALQDTERAVLGRFARDRVRFSDVLEPSLSCDRRGTHLYRFSYAFPGFRADPAGVAAELRALTSLFGEHAVDACDRVLRAARSRAVAQLLFGFAHDGGSSHRVKLYLQFTDGAPAAALDLSSRMLGMDLTAELGGAGRLHLLGLDLGSSGLAGAKLYFLQERLSVEALGKQLPGLPLARDVAAIGTRELRDVLLIHRVDGDDDEAHRRPSEVDFPLLSNKLSWEEVRGLPCVRDKLETSPEVDALTREFGLTMRRISASADGDKITVYYVLSELSPAAGAHDG